MADIKKINDKIQEGVVNGYQKIEDGVVCGYKKVEKGAVSGFDRVCNFFVAHLFTRRDETVEEARQRLSGRDREK